MDTIVELIHRKGIWAYVEMTGGNVATIHAGAQTPGPDSDTIYAAVAGPGSYGWGQRSSMGHTDEFFIGADDHGETEGIACATFGALTEQDVAELIVAQASLPLGACLSDGAAKRILVRAAVERILATAAAEVVTL
jgi:hypothetical protein